MSRLSSVPRLAGTDLHMPLRSADSVDTAWIVGQTGDPALVRVADLLLATVRVALALNRLATDLVVLGISEEFSLARAHRDVVVRSALCVASTEDQIARFLTLCLPDVVLHASLVVRAIVVGYAT